MDWALQAVWSQTVAIVLRRCESRFILFCRAGNRPSGSRILPTSCEGQPRTVLVIYSNQRSLPANIQVDL